MHLTPAPTRSATTPRPPPVRTRTVRVALLTLLTLLAAGLLVLAPPPAQAASEVGYLGPGYAGASAPTAEKPQSKLWFHDGSWWGVLFDATTRDFTIHQLERQTQTWVDSGVVVDPRASARMDVLRVGGTLYVASATTYAGGSGRVYRFGYDPGTRTYALDAGFPVTVVDGGVEAIVIDRDSTGRAWITYTRDSTVFLTHSQPDGTGWVAPYPLPVPGADNLTSDDISATVAFGGGRMGVMWGNQREDSYYFAVHQDGAGDREWTREVAYTRPEGADDHINLRTIVDDPEGRVFAMVKTSMDHAEDPLNIVLVRKPGGVWDTDNVFGSKGDDMTRATLVLDRQNDTVYGFAVGPCCSGGDVFVKKVSVQALLNGNPFGPGRGTTFMDRSDAPAINNPSGSKQPVSDATDLVLLAGDDSRHVYVHNEIDIGPADTTPPDTTVETGPASPSVERTATFTFSASEPGSTYACRLDAGPWGACTSPHDAPNLTTGDHTLAVRATDPSGNTDPSPATHDWTVDSTAPLSFTPSRDATVREAQPTTGYGDTPRLEADSSPTERALLAVTVTGAPTGTVTSATLRLWASNGSGNGPRLHTSDPGWREDTLTWAGQPTPGREVADVAAVPVGAWTEYDVTTAVSGNGTYGFTLVPESSDGVVFSSRQGDHPPQLVVETTGEATDTTPPDTTIDSGPSATTPDTTASFTFSASEPGSTYACRLDAGAWAGCSTPHVVAALAAGSHVLAVRATDLVGNTDPTPATHTWTVDTTAPLTFTPTRDASVREDRPTATDGSATRLVADASPRTRSLLGFDLGTLTGTVTSAELRLYVTNGTGNGPEVHRVTSSWDEASVSWATQPAYAPGVLADLGPVPAGAWVSIDVTPAVTGGGEVDLVLVPQSSDGLFVHSREDGSDPPRLVVTTTP